MTALSWKPAQGNQWPAGRAGRLREIEIRALSTVMVPTAVSGVKHLRARFTAR